jgi:hypothetical protein
MLFDLRIFSYNLHFFSISEYPSCCPPYILLKNILEACTYCNGWFYLLYYDAVTNLLTKYDAICSRYIEDHVIGYYLDNYISHVNNMDCLPNEPHRLTYRVHTKDTFTDEAYMYSTLDNTYRCFGGMMGSHYTYLNSEHSKKYIPK